MPISEDQVRRWLSAVKATGDDQDLVAARRLEWASILEDSVAIKLHLEAIADDPHAMEAVAGACLESIRQGAVRAGERVRALRVQFVNHSGEVIRESAFEASSKGALRPTGGLGSSLPPSAPPSQAPSPAEDTASLNASHVIAVGAGKGGGGQEHRLGLSRGRSRSPRSSGGAPRW